ncbi:hypothetical protein EVAR_12527_1 [Eumeta japonica]|uniref:Uncharacterized protein n=1 Tax=Eumeta variegata TaxID=151549 RepID=A0A4C1TPN9_EUMVA|nr:hypothetical protein EVAR_12527_1 [Eumeta japonica]
MIDSDTACNEPIEWRYITLERGRPVSGPLSSAADSGNERWVVKYNYLLNYHKRDTNTADRFCKVKTTRIDIYAVNITSGTEGLAPYPLRSRQLNYQNAQSVDIPKDTTRDMKILHALCHRGVRPNVIYKDLFFERQGPLSPRPAKRWQLQQSWDFSGTVAVTPQNPELIRNIVFYRTSPSARGRRYARYKSPRTQSGHAIGEPSARQRQPRSNIFLYGHPLPTVSHEKWSLTYPFLT